MDDNTETHTKPKIYDFSKRSPTLDYEGDYTSISNDYSLEDYDRVEPELDHKEGQTSISPDETSLCLASSTLGDSPMKREKRGDFIPMDRKCAEKLSNQFRVLRKNEYQSYLLEMRAIENCPRRATIVADKDPMTETQFLHSGHFLNDQQYLHRFKFRTFIRYLFAHMLFFFCGPLSYPISIPLFGMHDMRNMQFIGITPDSILQVVQWLGFALPTFWYIYNPDSGLFATELQSLAVNIFFRCFIIAVRYAYASDTLLFAQTRVPMTVREINRDLALLAWRNIPDKNIEMELEIAIIRQKLDQDFFNFSFAEEVADKEYLKLLRASHQAREEVFQSGTIEFKEQWQPRRRNKNVWTKNVKSRLKQIDDSGNNKTAESPGSQKISGKNLARELLIITRHNQRVLWTFLIYMTLILLIPTFFRIGFGIPPFGETYEIPIFVLLLLSSLAFNLQNLLFINLAYVDSGRRLFLMKALSSMISVHKDFSFRFLHKAPLIDIFDMGSLNSWYSLRNLCMDVGKRYEDKIYIYFSVVIVGYGVLAVWFVMLILGLIHIDSIDVNLQAVLVGNLLLLVFFYIAMVLVNGANINDHFKIHRDLLMKNRTHYSNAETYITHLDGGYRYVNPILSYAAKKFSSLPGLNEYQNLAGELIRTTDSLYDKLENDEIKSPYKILGIKVTWMLIGRVTTLLVSLCGFILQYYTNAFKIGGSNIE